MDLLKQVIRKFRPILKSILKYEFLHYWFKGGRGSTKSSFIAICLVVLMVIDKEFNAVCIRKVAETLQDSVYNQIIWAIELLGLSQYFKYKSSPLQIIYKPTGQRFYFRGCDRPEKIKSIKCKVGKLKAVWFEELTEFSGMKEVRTVTQSIVRGSDNILCFYSFNPPKDGKNWVNEEVERTRKNRFVSSSTYLDVPADWLGSNFLEEAEDLKEYKPDDYNNEYLGLTSKLTLNVVKNFNKSIQIRPINYNPDLDLHLTCDFNVDPMCWLMAHKTAEKVFYFDELAIENTYTRECIDEFIARYGDHRGKIIVNGDASGNYRSSTSEYTNYAIILQELYKHFGKDRVKLEIRDFNPPIINRINAFNQRVKTNKGIYNVYVDPKCQKLIYNIDYLKFKAGTSKIETPTLAEILRDNDLKYLGHPFDAASYLVEYYWAIIDTEAKQD
jgi:PBSX family phage terminase large subunit